MGHTAGNKTDEKEILKKVENIYNFIDNQSSDEEVLNKVVESSEKEVEKNNVDNQEPVSIIGEIMEVRDDTFSSQIKDVEEESVFEKPVETEERDKVEQVEEEVDEKINQSVAAGEKEVPKKDDK